MIPALLAAFGAACMVAAATGFLPRWLPESVAALIATIAVCSGLGLAEIGRLLREKGR